MVSSLIYQAESLGKYTMQSNYFRHTVDNYGTFGKWLRRRS